MRYNRNDYSACDWKATKSDALRKNQKAAPSLPVVKIMILVLAVAVSALTLWELVKGAGA